MKLTNQIITALFYVLLTTSCVNLKRRAPILSKKDTLKVGFLDTVLLGKQLFPTQINPYKFNNLDNEKVLLIFESGNYYYVFYNMKNKFDILSSTYWNEQIPKYINFKSNEGYQSYTRYVMVNYFDPFLTGFYNNNDSIIVQTSNMSISDYESINQFNVDFFSTSDTLIKLKENISVGDSLSNVLYKLHIPHFFNPQKEFELILMEATTQVNNVWDEDYLENCSDYTVAINLSIKNKILTRIQYLNLEYIDYVFLQRNVLTKNIHYH